MSFDAVSFLHGLYEPEIPESPDLPLEWHFEWDERAAIMEFDGEMPREQAEMLALQDVHRRMREQGVIP